MIKPGKTITQVYRLANHSEIDLVLTSRLVPFKPANELGNIQLEEQEISPASEWISFQNADLDLGDKFLLKAGQEQQVVLKAKIPPEAPEDDYYLTLLFESLPELNVNQSAARSKIKIGSNLLLTVSETGEPPRKAEIVEFKIKNIWFKMGRFSIIDSFINPAFILRIKNSGRSLFKPMGTLTVSGWTGGKYLLDLLPENILTNSIRQTQCFSADRNQPSPCQLETGWKNKFLIGPYQAQVNFGLDKISEDYQQTIHFFAFPFALIVTLFLLILIFWLIKKHSRPKDNLDNSS
ncbi:hypothetical protein MUP35_02120 [Patescibacteria group bacterium]|nr:hypothetical protein [Patescibacteria group bacterium]